MGNVWLPGRGWMLATEGPGGLSLSPPAGLPLEWAPLSGRYLPCGHSSAAVALDFHLSNISSSGNNFWSMIAGKMFFASSWLTHSPQNQSWGEDRAADLFVFPEMEVGTEHMD